MDGRTGPKSEEHRAKLRINIAIARSKRTFPPHTMETRQALSAARVQGDTRFWSKVTKTDGCWEWTGCRQKKTQYGSIGVGSRVDGTKRPVLVHRFSYELHFGPIPAGIKVLHSCDNRGCVRPEHLFLGTQIDNIRDMISKGRDDSFGHKKRRKSSAN